MPGLVGRHGARAAGNGRRPSPLGREFSREEFYDLGFRILEDEWEFNRRAGWKHEDDVMPKCMEEDAIGPQKLVFDVPKGVVQKTYEKIGSHDAFWGAGSQG